MEEAARIARFWSYIDKSGDCWNWTRATWEGYGAAIWNGKTVRAHRLAYELAVGPIPSGMLVCHHCDNPTCCNPAHLFIGTIQDNNADMRRKGRWHPHHGTDYRNAKLDDEKVRQIRRLWAAGMSQYELAGQFGVHQGTISQACRRDTWKHVE